MSKALTKRSEPSLFLIAPTVPAKFRNDLWGALVRKPYQPTAAFSTEDAAKKPLELAAKLEPEEAVITNYTQVLERCSQTDVRGKLQGVFSAFWSGDSSRGHSHSATRAEFWNMTSPQKRLAELMEVPAYRADAERFLQAAIANDDEVFFVTAMLTLADMAHEQHDASGARGGAGAVVREPQTGIPIVEGAFQHGHGTERAAAGTYVGTRIIAIGYHKVNYEKVKGLQGWRRKIFGRPRHEIQTVVRIGNGTLSELYKISPADDMEEGDVPTLEMPTVVLGGEGGYASDDAASPPVAGAEGEAAATGAAPFQIYSSFSIERKDGSESPESEKGRSPILRS